MNPASAFHIESDHMGHRDEWKGFIWLMITKNEKISPHTKRMVMESFQGDYREVYVISNSYAMRAH